MVIDIHWYIKSCIIVFTQINPSIVSSSSDSLPCGRQPPPLPWPLMTLRIHWNRFHFKVYPPPLQRTSPLSSSNRFHQMTWFRKNAFWSGKHQTSVPSQTTTSGPEVEVAKAVYGALLLLSTSNLRAPQQGTG